MFSSRWLFSILVILLASKGWAAGYCSNATHDQTDTSIDKSLESRLYSNFNCFGDVASNRSACNYFVGRSFKDFWNVGDFWLPNNNRFMTTAEMKVWLDKYGQQNGWKKIGDAASQASHDKASRYATMGKATLALLNTNGGIGHTALVLPGKPIASGSYGFGVVRIAQTSLDNIGRAFVGCAFSFGFSKPSASSVIFYVKD